MYFEIESVQCKACHRIGVGPGRVGPYLTEIGKKLDRPKLLESIIEPSKAIDPKYQIYVLQTTAGKVYTGAQVERTPQEVVMRNLKSELVRVRAADIEQLATQGISLMPKQLFRDLTAQGVADLLAY